MNRSNLQFHISFRPFCKHGLFMFFSSVFFLMIHFLFYVFAHLSLGPVLFVEEARWVREWHAQTYSQLDCWRDSHLRHKLKLLWLTWLADSTDYKNNYHLSGFVRAVGKSFYEKAEFDWYCQRCQKTVLSVSLVGVFHIFDFAKQTRPTNWLLTEQTWAKNFTASLCR